VKEQLPEKNGGRRGVIYASLASRRELKLPPEQQYHLEVSPVNEKIASALLFRQQAITVGSF
jgi:hypothetical protein